MADAHDAAEARDGRSARFHDSATLVGGPAGREQLKTDQRANLRRSDRAIQAHKPTTASAADVCKGVFFFICILGRIRAGRRPPEAAGAGGAAPLTSGAKLLDKCLNRLIFYILAVSSSS